jgi:hypothetical protein
MNAMKILCINLRSRLDRLEKVAIQFKKMQLEFERFDAIYNNIGALGCTKSHIECIKLAKERNHDFCMICEDDFEFKASRKNFEKIILNFLKQDAPILIVAGNTDPANISNYNDFFYRTTNTQTTTCYIIKKHYYDTLLENFFYSETKLSQQGKSELFALDVTWKSLQNRDLWLIPKIFCGCQRSSYSDIEKHIVNYESLFQSIYKNKYIIVNLAGGLGNRLFQVACGYSLAKRTNKTLLLRNKTENHHSLIDYMENVFRNFLAYENFIEINNQRTEQLEKALEYDAFLISNTDYNTELNGYFQNEKYFQDYENELINLIIDNDRCNLLKAKYNNILNGFFIHIRRADYLNANNISIHYIDLTTYYENTISLIKEKYGNDVTFYIFSDDITYCKSWNIFTNINKVFVEYENEIDVLYLMTLCKGGICCNSSFSWWGGYLNNNPNKSIYFPNKWFAQNSKEQYTDVGFYKSSIVNIATGKIQSALGKTYLMDVTFIIPLRIDHNDRLINIKLLLFYLTSNFNANIVVVENGPQSYQNEIMNDNKIQNKNFITYIFQYNENFMFHKTKIMNDCLQYVHTPIFAYNDSDVVLPLSSYGIATDKIRHCGVDICKPYDNPPGSYGIDINMRTEIYNKSLKDIQSRCTDYKSGYGGLIFFNKASFLEIGSMNENFYAYGPEDIEIVYRFIALRYNFCSLNKPLFHMNHFITTNSNQQNIHYQNNLILYTKIVSLNYDQLREFYKITTIKNNQPNTEILQEMKSMLSIEQPPQFIQQSKTIMLQRQKILQDLDHFQSKSKTIILQRPKISQDLIAHKQHIQNLSESIHHKIQKIKEARLK